MPRPRATAPRSELSRLQERLNKLLEQALVGGGGGMPPGGPQGLSGWKPLFDLVETNDDFILYAELPGVRRDLRLEGSYGPFKRRLELPEPVDPQRIEAKLRRGILEVTMPKRTPAR